MGSGFEVGVLEFRGFDFLDFRFLGFEFWGYQLLFLSCVDGSFWCM